MVFKNKKKMKILNLYAGIGGNRKLWKDVEVTAIENNDKIANIYQKFFQNDDVYVLDAHKYLLEHFKEFDFIWSSPPCPSHSHIRLELGVMNNKYKPVFPDMKLYEEIIFLKHHFKGKWVVENVVSYYEPLIKPQEVHRHYFWANFIIPNIRLQNDNIRNIGRTDTHFGFNLIGKKTGYRKDQVLRNLVNPELGLHILQLKKNKTH